MSLLESQGKNFHPYKMDNLVSFILTQGTIDYICDC